MAARGLTPRELRALIAEYGTLEAAKQARPDLAARIETSEQASRSLRLPLHALPEPALTAPVEPGVALLADIRDGLAAQRPDSAPAKGGRPKGSYVEPDTFKAVVKMIVDGHITARQIEDDTRKNEALEFVDRNKAGLIIRQINGHRRAAKTFLVSGKLPPGFRDTPLGVLLPNA